MLAITGCSNSNRQDDGFGVAVIAQSKKLNARLRLKLQDFAFIRSAAIQPARRRS
jgi:Ni,Fe-hydrogenase maturation factor